MRKYVLASLLIAYFMFTSGLIFEVTKSEIINRLDVPYSAISGDRTGVIGTFFTKNDVETAKWLASNSDNTSNIYADVNGQLLIGGYLRTWDFVNERGLLKEMPSYEIKYVEPCYIFLTEWNVKHNRLVWHNGTVGLREYGDIPWSMLSKKALIYTQGDARIYK